MFGEPTYSSHEDSIERKSNKPMGNAGKRILTQPDDNSFTAAQMRLHNLDKNAEDFAQLKITHLHAKTEIQGSNAGPSKKLT